MVAAGVVEFDADGAVWARATPTVAIPRRRDARNVRDVWFFMGALIYSFTLRRISTTRRFIAALKDYQFWLRDLGKTLPSAAGLAEQNE